MVDTSGMSGSEATVAEHAARPPADVSGYRPGMGRAVQLPLAAERAAQPRLAIVDVTIAGEEVHYDANVYTWLVRANRGKGGEEKTVRKAAELTGRIQSGELSFDEVVDQLQREAKDGMTRVTSALDAVPTKTTQVEKAAAAAPPAPAPTAAPREPDGIDALEELHRLQQENERLKKMMEPVNPASPKDFPTPIGAAELFLPKVRVIFEGKDLGRVSTRYHNVEQTDAFLVLIFDKRCEVVDMYEPPVMEQGLLTVTVDKDKFYVRSAGIHLDLEKRGLYLVVLMILPLDHPEAELAMAEEEGAFDDEKRMLQQAAGQGG